MVITKPICDICGTDKSETWMCQGSYHTCRQCSSDIQLFELQPMKNNNLKILLEVFFRRGNGENITYATLHKEKSNFKTYKY